MASAIAGKALCDFARRDEPLSRVASHLFLTTYCIVLMVCVKTSLEQRPVQSFRGGMPLRTNQRYSCVVASTRSIFTGIFPLLQRVNRRPNSPLEIWDYGTGELKESILWNRSTGQVSTPSCQFTCLTFKIRSYLVSPSLDLLETVALDHCWSS